MLAAETIVQRVAQALQGATAGQDRVFAERAWPLDETELPAWLVVAGDEDIEAQTVSYPAMQQHDLPVRCEGYVRVSERLDTEMHALTAEALKALYATAEGARLGLPNVHMSTQSIQREVTALNEAAVGRVTLNLNVRFATRANDPETIL